MKPKLLSDILLPAYGRWSPKAIYDPLHPIHGPLPDLAQLWECGKHRFRASVWVGQLSLYSMVELLLDDTTPLAPMLPIAEVHEVRGYIAQTYHWKIDRRSVSCFDVRVELPPSDCEEEEGRHQLLETVLQESVLFAVHRKG